MKVERRGSNDGTPPAAPAAIVIDSADSTRGNRFATAVREYHKRDAPAPARLQRRGCLPENGDSCTESHPSALGAVTLEPLCAVALVRPSTNPEPIANVRSAAVMRDARRKTSTTVDVETPPCIEVEHALSGTRFMLSRSDGVWLLTVQSAATSLPGVPAAISAIRARFEQLDLGPLDLLIA